MFVWKCVTRDRMGLFNFKYPAVGEVVRHQIKSEEWYVHRCLHACKAGSRNCECILYRPGGIWLLLETDKFAYGNIGDGHILFKEATVVAEFTKLSDLLARPEMKWQGGLMHVNNVIAGYNWAMAESGVCQVSPYITYAFGEEGAENWTKLASGPNGWIKSGDSIGYIGKDRDNKGNILRPYVWYKRLLSEWVRCN